MSRIKQLCGIAVIGFSICIRVHGKDGLDEITLTGTMRVAQLRDGMV